MAAVPMVKNKEQMLLSLQFSKNSCNSSSIIRGPPNSKKYADMSNLAQLYEEQQCREEGLCEKVGLQLRKQGGPKAACQPRAVKEE